MPVESLRQSAILIPEGDSLRVYHSIEELPWRLRARLSDPRWDYATILIADRRGREEIAKALRGQPTALRFRSFREAAKPRNASLAGPRPGLILWLAAAVGSGALLALAWLLWLR